MILRFACFTSLPMHFTHVVCSQIHLDSADLKVTCGIGSDFGEAQTMNLTINGQHWPWNMEDHQHCEQLSTFKRLVGYCNLVWFCTRTCICLYCSLEEPLEQCYSVDQRICYFDFVLEC